MALGANVGMTAGDDAAPGRQETATATTARHND